MTSNSYQNQQLHWSIFEIHINHFWSEFQILHFISQQFYVETEQYSDRDLKRIFRRIQQWEQISIYSLKAVYMDYENKRT